MVISATTATKPPRHPETLGDAQHVGGADLQLCRGIQGDHLRQREPRQGQADPTRHGWWPVAQGELNKAAKDQIRGIHQVLVHELWGSPTCLQLKACPKWW